jgi:hypothetical protein
MRRFIEGIVVIIVGVILMLIGNSIPYPYPYTTFLGIPFSSPIYFANRAQIVPDGTVAAERFLLAVGGLIAIIVGLVVILYSIINYRDLESLKWANPERNQRWKQQ